METNTQLIANHESYRDPWKQSKIAQIILLLKGALRAENMVALKMNIPRKDVEKIVSYAAEPECTHSCGFISIRLGIGGNRRGRQGGEGSYSTTDGRRRTGDYRIFLEQSHLIKRRNYGQIKTWNTPNE